MVKCSFCGKTVIPGTGIVFVTKKGNILNFCSSKCMKNYKLKRKPIKIKWTAKHRELRNVKSSSKKGKKGKTSVKKKAKK